LSASIYKTPNDSFSLVGDAVDQRWLKTSDLGSSSKVRGFHINIRIRCRAD
jgi:hypothetical protein